MGKNISASVGHLGANREDDVFTIQELLNEAPPDEGGPVPFLDYDGICGPKTKEAIRKFQLKHFGFKGADGKVDPGKQTLAKLNEIFDRLRPELQKPKTPPAPRKLFTKFVFHQPGKAQTVIPPSDPNHGTHFFFKVTGTENTGTSEQCVYWFGPPNGYEKVAAKPTFHGPGAALTIFELNAPGQAVSDFATRSAMYVTRHTKNGPSSTLVLLFRLIDDRTKQLRIPLTRHLARLFNPKLNDQELDPGEFQIVTNPERWVG